MARISGQHGGVSELVWDKVRSFFDPDLMGRLPEVWITDTSVEDWQMVLDLIETHGWRSEYREGDVVMSLPRAEQVLSRPVDAECPELRVWPAPDVLAIFRFLEDNGIDFDVDLRELQGQERLDILCEFITTIGRRLGKPVMMSPEGDWDRSDPVLGFDVEADRVVLLAQPWFG
ncbi:hypothetical protein FHU36_006781 [Nonomuraea muscovyensis]|uniref:Uncharacterized protein n=1 Tax=Nonomuraea muscovyensis TaxID=1124761 RepID=A0A7X0F1Y0_9ACTN|nr:hypothetical protein [Nonomuraea muscovyensis]MBB6350209.1 hypothetical protein [Nonomuraea muscovyensis]